MIDDDRSSTAGEEQQVRADAAGSLAATSPSRGLEQPPPGHRGADIRLNARPHEATGEPSASKACSIDEYCDFLRARYRSGTPEGELAQARLILAGWTPPELERMWIPE